jgi:electron transport complex protein RnfG
MAKKQFSDVQIFIILTVVSVASAGILAFTYNFTKDPIAKSEARKKEEALRIVLPPETTKINSQKITVEGEEVELSIGEDKNGAVLGYAIQSITKKGFGGEIIFLLGLDLEGKITTYNVISHTETPGLGDGINSEKFKKQFTGKNYENFTFKVVKDGGNVQAITAATISSRAACKALDKGLKYFKAYKTQGSQK